MFHFVSLADRPRSMRKSFFPLSSEWQPVAPTVWQSNIPALESPGIRAGQIAPREGCER